MKPRLCENPPHSCACALSTPLCFVTDAERYNNCYRVRQITKWARVLHIWAIESYPSQPHPSYPIMPLPPLPLYRFVLGQSSPWRVKQPTGERLKVWDLPYNSSLGSVDPLHLHELHLESEKHILLMQSRDIKDLFLYIWHLILTHYDEQKHYDIIVSRTICLDVFCWMFWSQNELNMQIYPVKQPINDEMSIWSCNSKIIKI